MKSSLKSSLKIMTAASLLVLAQGASAACAIATVKGTWGFSYEATNLEGVRTCAGLGFMTFNSGQGSANTVKITLQRESCNGSAVSTPGATGNGTFSVSSTCTGRSINIKYPASSQTGRLDFNIVEAGTRLQYVLVIDAGNNGITMHGDAFKR